MNEMNETFNERYTGTKTILECCYDKVWGNGIPLSNPDYINSKKFTKQGIRGSRLEHVREVLLNPDTNTTNMKIVPGLMNPNLNHTSDIPLPNQSVTSALPVETRALPK